ncbi:hypothetical protein FIU89_11600 [Roseovarius sp. THAF27]|nr:hypothetical protein FIU89_11600 [Roseovarius sp. THAF27]
MQVPRIYLMCQVKDRTLRISFAAQAPGKNKPRHLTCRGFVMAQVRRNAWESARRPDVGQATIFLTTSPKEDGVGTMVTPACFRMSTFSCADSPKADTMAPAWPMRRPFGADRPAI